jgi:hypothetical protein
MKKLLLTILIICFSFNISVAEIIKFEKCSGEKYGYKFNSDVYEEYSFKIDTIKKKVYTKIVFKDDFVKKQNKKYGENQQSKYLLMDYDIEYMDESFIKVSIKKSDISWEHIYDLNNKERQSTFNNKATNSTTIKFVKCE